VRVEISAFYRSAKSFIIFAKYSDFVNASSAYAAPSQAGSGVSGFSGGGFGGGGGSW